MSGVYVLVTAARNEEAYIEMTIKSVIEQTVLPRKWVIVSDGSTDRTDDIAKQYAAEYDFIEYTRLESKAERDFACQVYGQHAGAEQLKDIDYDFIGMLDGDISLKPDYYERILTEFERDPHLGLAGGVPLDLWNDKWIRQKVNTSLNVSGPIQMFRRRCFEDIGGYIPLEKGGQDAIAEVMVRMHGWKVRSFPDIEVLHYRPTGSCCGNALVRCFHFGIRDYSYGSHPVFELVKCLSRIGDRPYLISSLSRMSGYCWASIRRQARTIPAPVIDYLRREQMRRVWRAMSNQPN